MKLVTLLSTAALLTTTLAAGDYDAVGKAMRNAWPQVATVAVVCDSANNKGALDAIAGAMPGIMIRPGSPRYATPMARHSPAGASGRTGRRRYAPPW